MNRLSPENNTNLLIPLLITNLLLFYFLFCLEILIKQVTVMNTKIILSFLLIIFSITACDTTEPPPPPDGEKPTLALAIDDASCTEAWLQLTTKDLELPAELTLKQYNPTGDSLSKDFILNTQDSLLYIDSLLPNQTYKFHTTIQSSSYTSNELDVTTMDTTSHDFTFQTWTFGTIGSSILYDVAIINENNIWAVGEILVADTSQNGYTTYNAVHWDGNEWEIIRIKTNACGGVEYPPIQTIFAFSSNDILFAHIDGSITHYNGIEFINNCSLITQLNGSVNKIWGISKNDFYVVSGNGFIAHYNGTRWSRIESGTDLNINDIWGDYNEKTNEWEILAVASNFGSSSEKKILQIKNDTALNTSLSSQMWPLKTVWFISNQQYYVAGAGIYQKKLLSDLLWKNQALDITTYSTYSIRGNSINDVTGVGAFGDFVHFNGVSWKTDYVAPNLNYGSYQSVNVSGNITYAVGDEYSQAVILKIKR